MWKKILGVVVVLMLALIGLIAAQPKESKIERSIVIAASAPVVFGHLNDYHRFVEWSPWAKLDPAMTQTFSGPESGVGAVYEWKGNSDVGEGRMTLESIEPNVRVTTKLEFIAPFADTTKTHWVISPDPGGSKVTWTLEGENRFVEKAFALLLNMDEMVGKDFEAGLRTLKANAEASAAATAPAAPIAPPATAAAPAATVAAPGGTVAAPAATVAAPAATVAAPGGTVAAPVGAPRLATPNANPSALLPTSAAGR
jgi:hypothetical protein